MSMEDGVKRMKETNKNAKPTPREGNKGNVMPMVGKKKFSYTKAGKRKRKLMLKKLERR